MGERYKEFCDDNSDIRNDLTTLKDLALNVPTKALADFGCNQLAKLNG